jgi:hypothetical protein
MMACCPSADETAALLDAGGIAYCTGTSIALQPASASDAATTPKRKATY